MTTWHTLHCRSAHAPHVEACCASAISTVHAGAYTRRRTSSANSSASLVQLCDGVCKAVSVLHCGASAAPLPTKPPEPSDGAHIGRCPEHPALQLWGNRLRPTSRTCRIGQRALSEPHLQASSRYRIRENARRMSKRSHHRSADEEAGGDHGFLRLHRELYERPISAPTLSPNGCLLQASSDGKERNV